MLTIDAAVLEKVDSFLAEHHIDRHERIGVAFSGGSDSLALLLALAQLYEPHLLHVMYVQHHLRPDSELEAEIALNRENCQKLGVPLHVLDLGKGRVEQSAASRKGGIEEAARHLRYEALYSECSQAGCSYLATAHNADDRLETLLMRLFQGSSIAALEGVRVLRTVDECNITLVRPVLACSHEELSNSVKQHNMVWSEDSSNGEDAYLRNIIRHTITPPILSVFGGAYEAVALMTKRFGEVGHLLEVLTENCLKAVSFSADRIVFSRSWFNSLSPALRDLVLFRIVSYHDEGNRIKNSFIQRLRSALEMRRDDDGWILESGAHRLQVDQDVCSYYVVRESDWQFCLALANPGEVQTLDLGNNVLFSIQIYEENLADPTLLALDEAMLQGAVLRSVQPCDEIALEGGTVKVTKLLSSYKIPKHLHPSVPVLADRNGLVAVFARLHGGRDRLAKRFKAPLARRLTNIYSSNIRKHCSEIE
ncbi:MAG: tRNA lysidine(34) synthetase TilS [Sphaerochaeta sp.]|uniref:tRNA lysidine(34) synthetase TilS n=1 Tax=Sphaerochaeta sp. TaxID=1972642 RepID=UPI002A35AD6B|nr:tRNA lysidine(34) synthetase TilS [Sphaerochaeta sp.]MDX9825004.1 tRNA lysidine(34) synthetase TilS [Sphaerochaeta sp.]